MEILPCAILITNLFLVLITAGYVILTFKMLAEMREARKTEMRPYIKASLVLIGSSVFLTIQNIGKGAAININAEFSLIPSENAKSTWQYRLLTPSELIRFILPVPNKEIKLLELNDLIKKYKKVFVKISYKDVFNEAHTETVSLNLQEFKEGLYGAGMITDTSMKEDIEDIKEHIKDIKDYIKDIKEDIKKHLKGIKDMSNKNKQR